MTTDNSDEDTISKTEKTEQETPVNELEDAIENAQESTSHYLSGPRLYFAAAGVFLSIFLVNIEITIVSTSLVSMTDDLHGFGRSSWVITAYLLTYTGFMVILAKLSDLIGRKSVLLASLIIFTIFSGACGAVQTMTQLIITRAFQGFGASGIYSLGIIVVLEMVPTTKYPLYTALVSGVVALSLSLGPLLGGLINNHTTWRWVFLMNVPGGLVACLLLILFLPHNFPLHGTSTKRPAFSIQRLDLIGGFSMLAGLTLLIVGFEEASSFAPWVSAQVLVPILVAVPICGFFVYYERRVTLRDSDFPEPLFPWRFCTSRVVMGYLATTFLVGCVYTTCMIQIPLRFQSVNHLSPWQAGVRLIAFSLAAPVGSGTFAAVCKKRRLPPIYLCILSAILQIIGITFLGRISPEDVNWKGQFGMQFIVGFGCGLTIAATTVIVPLVVDKNDLAISTSATVQFRMVGGALALAVVTAVMNRDLTKTLDSILSSEQITQIFRTTEAIATLPDGVKQIVEAVFLKGYNMQFRIVLGFAGAQLLAIALIWQREALRID